MKTFCLSFIHFFLELLKWLQFIQQSLGGYFLSFHMPGNFLSDFHVIHFLSILFTGSRTDDTNLSMQSF